MARLYLVRHGEAAPPGILAGSADYGLTPAGRAQVETRRDELAAVTFSAAWASPLRRARQTARIILGGNPANTAGLTIVPDLREIRLGEWEGKDTQWIRAVWPREWEARGIDPANAAPPGGESFAMLAERVLPAFSAICREAESHACSLLAAHQAVNRVIIAAATGLPLGRLLHIPQALAAVSVFEIRGGAVTLLE